MGVVALSEEEAGEMVNLGLVRLLGSVRLKAAVTCSVTASSPRVYGPRFDEPSLVPCAGWPATCPGSATLWHSTFCTRHGPLTPACPAPTGR